MKRAYCARLFINGETVQRFSYLLFATANGAQGCELPAYARGYDVTCPHQTTAWQASRRDSWARSRALVYYCPVPPSAQSHIFADHRRSPLLAAFFFYPPI